MALVSNDLWIAYYESQLAELRMARARPEPDAPAPSEEAAP